MFEPIRRIHRGTLRKERRKKNDQVPASQQLKPGSPFPGEDLTRAHFSQAFLSEIHKEKTFNTEITAMKMSLLSSSSSALV